MLRLNDEQMERILGGLLRTGVLLAAGMVLIGGILHLMIDGTTVPHYQVFHGEPASLRTVSGIVRGALTFNAQSVIQLSLLLLIATPVARVISSIFVFALERDYTYVLVTLLVLAILVYSLSGRSL